MDSHGKGEDGNELQSFSIAHEKRKLCKKDTEESGSSDWLDIVQENSSEPQQPKPKARAKVAAKAMGTATNLLLAPKRAGATTPASADNPPPRSADARPRRWASGAVGKAGSTVIDVGDDSQPDVTLKVAPSVQQREIAAAQGVLVKVRKMLEEAQHTPGLSGMTVAKLQALIGTVEKKTPGEVSRAPGNVWKPFFEQHYYFT